MASAVKTLLWAWVIGKSVVSLVTIPEITDESFIDECVRGHNRARSSVRPAASDMLYMTWDKDLSVTAREWARRCLFEHNPERNLVGPTHPNFSFVGENLWTVYPPTLFNASVAIQNWVDENRNYDYDSDTCTDVCDHYKQVVWATTTKVGCAAHLCPNGVQTTNFADKEGIIFVCNYAPAGIINGAQPYRTEGKFCSGCEGVCVEKLCRRRERESLQSSDVDIDWDSFQNPTDFDYRRILIIRPLGLVATLAAAYGFHHLYPNIFCYE
ncbi:GLIPR1-like protein 1 [Takifugu rubripes]|uniref:GLIPR1-like protein 1 n=1 Tax=Takifugu rubripes TaxID=31033 RepID=UPI0011453D48|nr:GLIPR1-like protein 1 [Takifugu rubripes]